MKNVILGFLGSLILVYILLFSFSVYTIETSRQAMENGVSEVLSGIMNRYYTGEESEISENVEGILITGLQKRLQTQMGSTVDQASTGDTAADSLADAGSRFSEENNYGIQNLQIGVIVCDMKRGILSVNVKEEIKLPLVGSRTLTCKKTILVDRSSETEDSQVSSKTSSKTESTGKSTAEITGINMIFTDAAKAAVKSAILLNTGEEESGENAENENPVSDSSGQDSTGEITIYTGEEKSEEMEGDENSGADSSDQDAAGGITIYTGEEECEGAAENENSGSVSSDQDTAGGITIYTGGENTGAEPSGVIAGIAGAEAFYRTYGRQTIFIPSSDVDGMIYFGTAANSGGQYSISFETVGWQMCVTDEEGRELEVLNCKLGGNQLRMISEERKGNYSYRMYGISLSGLKALMNGEAAEALEKGKCRILLNACMIVHQNGSAGGWMEDDGTCCGTVYTTYQGIACAAGWQGSTVEDLKSYYGKEITGLFCHLQLAGDEGTEEVYGSGQYLYGTDVTISVKCREEYKFLGWYTEDSENIGNAESGENAESRENAENQAGAGNLQNALTENPDYTFRILADQILYVKTRSDRKPEIQAASRYYALEDAKNGFITEEEILSHILAEDPEDGILQMPDVSISDFDETEIRNVEAGNQIAITVEAEDSDGNHIEKEILLYFVDTEIKSGIEVTGQTRFISEEYENTLMEHSIWRENAEYRSLLESVLQAAE